MMKKIFLLCLIFIQAGQLRAQSDSDTEKNQLITYITCKIRNSTKHDTLSLVLNGPFFNYMLQQVPERYSPQTLTAVADDEGIAKFKISRQNAPFHATLFLSSRRNEDGYLMGKGNLSNYLIMPGDDINIEFDGDNKTFTGSEANLFEVQYEIEKTDKDQLLLKQNQNDCLKTAPEIWLKEKDSLLKVQLGLLASYQSRISPLAYSIIRADVIGLNRGSVYEAISFTRPFMATGISLGEGLNNVYQQMEKSAYYVSLNDRACLSPKYVYYLYEKLKLETKYKKILEKIDPRSDQNYFPKISSEFKGILRDKLLTRWIIEVAMVNNLQPEYANNALAVMQTASFINTINQLKNAYEKGQPVSDFDFKDSKGQTVHLADFRGKVVVVDMWFTGCGVCREVAAHLPNIEARFKHRSDIVFVTISIDQNREVWLKSIDKENGNYYVTPSTCYLFTSGTGERNSFIQKYVPSGSYPSMLIIDKEGKIFSSTPTHPLNNESQKMLVSEISIALTGK